MDRSHPVLLFDGVCNFCNGWVNFVIDHDPQAHIHFAPLQSKAAHNLLRQYNISHRKMDTIILVDNGKIYEKSDALLRLFTYLTGIVRWLRFCAIIPRFIRNRIYNLIARNRYAWFGKQEQCRLPEPGIKERFLELSDRV
ncbi:MAG: thiol-disulfide oxidoreductase DCC family protein [Balneolales bacterium]